MKRTTIILLLLLFLTSLTAAEAINESRYWTIDNYNIRATMNEDGVFFVEESISVTFHGQYHGIVKTIPATNDVRNLKCSAPFVVETEGGNLAIKMGDSDVLITGPTEYHISYDMDPRFTGECVYSIPGTWSVDVNNLSFSLKVPKDKFYMVAMVIGDLLPSGKSFETSEDSEGNLIINGFASCIPAYGYLEIILR